ncbi:MAG: YdcF family protein [Chromatiaceae bacterium]|nr:YdcF family protein [Chromatiaceae bacterium]
MFSGWGMFSAGQRLILVTSATHMPRAMRHFQTVVGLDPISAPTQYLTVGGSLSVW